MYFTVKVATKDIGGEYKPFCSCDAPFMMDHLKTIANDGSLRPKYPRGAFLVDKLNEFKANAGTPEGKVAFDNFGANLTAGLSNFDLRSFKQSEVHNSVPSAIIETAPNNQLFKVFAVTQISVSGQYLPDTVSRQGSTVMLPIADKGSIAFSLERLIIRGPADARLNGPNSDFTNRFKSTGAVFNKNAALTQSAISGW